MTLELPALCFTGNQGTDQANVARLAEIKLTYLSTASVSENPDEVVRSPQKHFVAGSSTEVTRELERFHEVGVTHCMFRFLDPESLERLVRTVVPHFA